MLDAATGEREQRTAYEVSVRLIRRKEEAEMSVEHIGKGYVKICVSEEELENSIAGLSQLNLFANASNERERKKHKAGAY